MFLCTDSSRYLVYSGINNFFRISRSKIDYCIVCNKYYRLSFCSLVILIFFTLKSHISQLSSWWNVCYTIYQIKTLILYDPFLNFWAFEPSSKAMVWVQSYNFWLSPKWQSEMIVKLLGPYEAYTDHYFKVNVYASDSVKPAKIDLIIMFCS